MRPLKKVKTEWSSTFSYAVGLLAADGNLSKDGRHLNITSKDEEIILNFKACLRLNNKVGMKSRGVGTEKKYYLLQFGDVNFYTFLLDIGLKPNKSKTLSSLKVPDEFFSDFLRGYFDGDGSIGMHRHPESKYMQLRVRIASGSKPFLSWMHKKISNNTNVAGGWITQVPRAHQLCYGKKDSLELLQFMYNGDNIPLLKRKYNTYKDFIKSL